MPSPSPSAALASLLALLSSGCASTPLPEHASPAPPVAPPPPAPPVAPPAAPPVAAVDPCAEGPVHDAIAALAPGQVLAERRAAGPRRAWERLADLGPLFPALRADGHQALAVTPTDAFEGPALIALMARAGATIDEQHQVSSLELGVLACRPGVGWALVAPPYGTSGDAGLQLFPAQTTQLPGGGRAVTVRVFSFLSTLETNLSAFLVGTATAAFPVTQPRGASVGVLGVIGTTAERVVAEGTGEYRTTAALDATGWFPSGSDGQVFVRLVRERTPEEGGRWSDGLLATPLASMDARGFHTSDSEAPVWLMLGPGDSPAWCAGSAGVRCERLTLDGQPVTDLATPFAWVAGAWPVEGAAAPRALRAPGARWLHAGSWDGDRPPRDPSGRAPLTTVAVRPPPASSDRRR